MDRHLGIKHGHAYTIKHIVHAGFQSPCPRMGQTPDPNSAARAHLVVTLLMGSSDALVLEMHTHPRTWSMQIFRVWGQARVQASGGPRNACQAHLVVTFLIGSSDGSPSSTSGVASPPAPAWVCSPASGCAAAAS